MCNPTVRKLSTLYNAQIIIINRNEEIFKYSPYVERVIHPDNFDKNTLLPTQEFFESCVLKGKQNQFGIERHFNTFDIRQIHCNDLGFYLMPEELNCDFVPEPGTEVILKDLPKNFVVLHTSTNWPNRTWAKENWQSIIQYLSDKKIFTILIGKDMEEFLHPSIGNKVEKKSYQYNNLFGIDLTNKTTLSQSWHLLNNSKYVITMDTGILHLAGTTDTFIIQLGSAKDPRRVAPYRLGSQNYKYKHIKGPCDIYCTNNLKYAVKEWKTINAVPPLIDCLENKATFECQPTSEQVINFLKTL